MFRPAVDALIAGRSTLTLATLVLALVPTLANAQASGAAQSGPSEQDPEIRFRVPTITVTALKEPEDQQKVPVSVTAVSRETHRERGHPHRQRGGDLRAQHLLHRVVGPEVEQRAFPWHRLEPEQPGHHDLFRRRAAAERQLVEHRAARHRVRSSSCAARRARCSAATRSAASSTSRAPGRRSRAWTGTLSCRSATTASWAVRGGVGGPVINGHVQRRRVIRQVDRDGFTVNEVTGNDIDSRSAFSGKAQMLWTPNDAWEGRVIFSGERARDGDYALNDVGALRDESVSRCARFRGSGRPRRPRHDRARAPRAGGPVVVLEHDRVRQLEDAGRDRPRLHAVADRSRATTPKRTSSSRRSSASRPPTARR